MPDVRELFANGFSGLVDSLREAGIEDDTEIRISGEVFFALCRVAQEAEAVLPMVFSEAGDKLAESLAELKSAFPIISKEESPAPGFNPTILGDSDDG